MVQGEKPVMLLIDTHIVIWLYQNMIDRLFASDKDILEKNEIFISPITVLEIEYLFEIGRIKKNADTIIEYLAQKIGLQIDNGNFTQIIKNSLKEKWTSDPFDRIIVSHAKLRDAFLLTKDKKIRKHYDKCV